MRNKKYGFTLAEVLLTLLIIGIIMAMAVPVIVSVKNSYTKSTYYVYNSLQAAVTKIMSGSPHPTMTFDNNGNPVVDTGFNGSDIYNSTPTNNSQHFVSTTSANVDGETVTKARGILFSCTTASGTKLNLIRGVDIPTDKEFPSHDPDTGKLIRYPCSEYQSLSDNQSKLFCEALASLSNTGKKSRAIDCEDLKPIDGANTDEPRIESNALRAVYSKPQTAKPNFISNNGYWYYVSQWAKRNNNDPYGYRLVAVDLNNKRLPNISDPVGGKFPDIVTFIVWDTGAIYPVGVAADDYVSNDGKHRTLYLPSDAKGYQYTDQTAACEADPDACENVPRECNINGSAAKWVGKLAPANCTYAVKNIEDSVFPRNNGNYSKMTFREAYCTAYYQREGWEGNIAYHPNSFSYCSATDEYGNPLVNFQPDFEEKHCPEKGGIRTPSPPDGTEYKYDRCTVDPVKPSFKFKLEY